MTDDSPTRRKELIREYKRTPKDMGVYLIRNTNNGKCYVASSVDIRARINRHKTALKRNFDEVRELQDDWNRFGGEGFEFETVDLLEPSPEPGYRPNEDLKVLEALWLEKLEPFGERGYNKKR